MVEQTKRRIQAWYLCALLHYQGKVNNEDQWCVALLRRHYTTPGGVQTRWEFIENLDFESAQEFLEHVRPRLVRCTAGDLKKVVGGIPDEE